MSDAGTVIDIDADDLGTLAGRANIIGSLAGRILWPHDGQKAEWWRQAVVAMSARSAVREGLTSDKSVSADVYADHVDGAILAGALRDQALWQYRQASQAGLLLAATVDSRCECGFGSVHLPHGVMGHRGTMTLTAAQRKFAFTREIQGRRPYPETPASVEKRWRQFRPVAALMAAHIAGRFDAPKFVVTDIYMPCTPAGLPQFLHVAETIRRGAIRAGFPMAEELLRFPDAILNTVRTSPHDDFSPRVTFGPDPSEAA